ncbi:MAG: hypothetical protein R3A80_02155 [Bdellovibrionota bacterium]
MNKGSQFMKVQLLTLYLLVSMGSAWSTDCRSQLGGLEKVDFRGGTKVEIEATLLELIQQTGANPMAPDYRHIRDGSRFTLAVPGVFSSEYGMLQLSYEVYRFEAQDYKPSAHLASLLFISDKGERKVITFDQEEIGVLGQRPVFASLSGTLVSDYVFFMRPFASSKMADGSLVPAHNLNRLARVRSLQEAKDLRRQAQLINMKNFLVEACKRYGLYTLLSLTGIRQLLLMNSREDTAQEELEELEEEMSEVNSQLISAGISLFHGESGVVYLLRENGEYFELIDKDLAAPHANTVLERFDGKLFLVKESSPQVILLEKK